MDWEQELQEKANSVKEFEIRARNISSDRIQTAITEIKREIIDRIISGKSIEERSAHDMNTLNLSSSILTFPKTVEEFAEEYKLIQNFLRTQDSTIERTENNNEKHYDSLIDVVVNRLHDQVEEIRLTDGQVMYTSEAIFEKALLESKEFQAFEKTPLTLEYIKELAQEFGKELPVWKFTSEERLDAAFEGARNWFRMNCEHFGIFEHVELDVDAIVADVKKISINPNLTENEFKEKVQKRLGILCGEHADSFYTLGFQYLWNDGIKSTVKEMENKPSLLSLAKQTGTVIHQPSQVLAI